MKADLKYYKQIFNDIDRKEKTNLFLLVGPERFIMEEIARRITDSTVTDDLRSFNLTVTYGAEVDINTFMVTARSYPFMADRRVLVLKELQMLRGSWQKLIEYCNEPVPSSILILLYDESDIPGVRTRRHRDFGKLKSAMESNGKTIRCERLTDRDILRWIRQKANRMGLDMNMTTADAMLRSVGENLFELQNELEKLSLFFEKKHLTGDDIEKVIGTYKLNAISDLVENIRPGNDNQVLRILSRIMKTGAERPSIVVYHLIRHFLSLLKIKSGYQTGGFRFGELKRKADLFKTREIILWLENLRLAEMVMKSISFPEEVLLVGVFLHSMRQTSIENPVGLLSLP